LPSISTPHYAHAHGPVAVLVDGAFFVARYKYLTGNKKPSAEDCAKAMYERAGWHSQGCELYRVFYYDCPPLDHNITNPISKKTIKLGRTEIAKFGTSLHEELRSMRKVALRMGVVRDGKKWLIKPPVTKKILEGKLSVGQIQHDHIKPEMTQKGVDMKIGLDIASLAFKRQVRRIVLISGDSDFVPAAKLARREGVDFVLDSMGMDIKGELFEHIDGLYGPP